MKGNRNKGRIWPVDKMIFSFKFSCKYIKNSDMDLEFILLPEELLHTIFFTKSNTDFNFFLFVYFPVCNFFIYINLDPRSILFMP